jgi:hypothetical protein
MTRKTCTAAAVALLLLFAGSVPAYAGVVTFDFNALASGASSSTIQAYMNSVLAGNATVSVSSGAQAAKGYNGDGHVVGLGSSTVSRTLGTTEGGSGALNGGGSTNITCGTTGCSGSNLDTWIRNASGISSFVFNFSDNVVIDSVSFDYEIFPDASCTALTAAACGGAMLPSGYYPSQPDFKFSTDLGQVFQAVGTTPTSANNDSPASLTELTPQKAPINTGLLTSGVAGSNVLTFEDWPAAIGIDNLVINYHTTPVGTAAVPEPASLVLLSTGLLSLGAAVRRRRRERKTP